MNRSTSPRSVRKTLGALLALALGVGVVVSPLLAQPAAANPVPAEFQFSGKGWGHGLGMSQYGARGMAQEGKSSAQILSHYYTGTTLSAEEPDRVLHVQVLAPSQNHSLRVTRTGGAWQLEQGQGATKTVHPVTAERIDFQYTPGANGALGSVTATAGELSLTAAAADKTDALLLVPRDGAIINVPGANATTGSVNYKHDYLQFTPLVTGSTAGINVVSRVWLETYLRGLAEMPSSWPAAALEAQAIAGRTYALRKTGLRADCQCHLVDETGDQKYTAWNKENETNWGHRWVAAVEATAGKALKHDGAYAQTYYSSSSGGRTQNSEDVWGGGAIAYLRSKDDPWSLLPQNPRANWTTTYSNADLTAFINDPARARYRMDTAQLPDIASIEVLAIAESGAVKQVRITSSSGLSTTSLPRTDSVRSLLGLNSAYFSVTAAGEIPPAVTAPTGTRLAGDTRFGTAVAIGQRAFPRSTTAVLVSGSDASIVDGLVAAPLAFKHSAPLLLTRTAALPTETKTDLITRGVTSVTLVGGDQVIAPSVVAELESMQISVNRISGSTRYETAVNVAAAVGTTNGVIIASGAAANLIDAAGAGGAAASTAKPILLVSAQGVPAEVRELLTGYSRPVAVVGGESAISSQTFLALAQILQTPLTRVSGENRYSTAAEVASYLHSGPTTPVALASGKNESLVDSLTGGSLGIALLLVRADAETPETANWLAYHRVTDAYLLGGSAALSEESFQRVKY